MYLWLIALIICFLIKRKFPKDFLVIKSFEKYAKYDEN